jgi:nucleotide-binding universal stress UspA family protein
MYRTILVGYDDTDSARDALALAGRLAQTEDAKVIAADVYSGDRYLFPVPGYADWMLSVKDVAVETVRGARKAASVGADHLELKTVAANSPAHGLQDLAEDLDVDMIVVGPSERSRLGQALLGTTGQRLLHGSPCPVSVAPAGFRQTGGPLGKVIAVGYDGSPEAKVALEAACELTLESRGRIRLLSVVESPQFSHRKDDGAQRDFQDLPTAVERFKQSELDEALATVPYGIPCEGVLLRGEAAPNLAKAAGDVDLLFLGSRGYGPVGRVVIGSVSSVVVVTASCPVVVCPRSADHRSPQPERTAVAH